MLVSVDAYGDRVSIVHSCLVDSCERLPGDFTGLPWNLDVDATSHVHGISLLDIVLVGEDLLELPNSIPGIILFDVF